MMNSSLQQGKVPECLKEATVRLLSKKLAFNPIIQDNYCPVSSVTSLGKVLEHMVASQLQRFLDETDYLNPFLASCLVIRWGQHWLS